MASEHTTQVSSGHLLAVALGPVQDFIAQARRSRDLWFGSHVLSEISKAAAAELANRFDATLIFPPFDKGDTALDEDSDDSVSNKILAQLPSDIDPEQAGRACVKAARERWKQIATDVKGDIHAGPLIDGSADDAWRHQVDSLLEIYAAWTPAADDFDQARMQLDTAIAARKTLKDFAQDPRSSVRAGVPTSSLDGGRYSVLAGDRKQTTFAKAAERYRIPNTEHLDAIGIVKRCGGDPEQFTPVANVALATWLRAARRDAKGANALDELSRDPQAKKFGSLKPNSPHGKILAVDAQALIESRLASLCKEIGDVSGELATRIQEDFKDSYIDPAQSAVARAIEVERPVEPPHHVAVLVADGDNMGKLIQSVSTLDGANGLRNVSRCLSNFAGKVEDEVQRHDGSLIYAGGDDVLAFAPLETVVSCAKALHDLFEREMAPCVPDGNDAPTLSVGIGIGHVLTGMGELLDLGRNAERLAKNAQASKRDQRNALAIRFDKRGGASHEWRQQWPSDPVTELESAKTRIRRDATTSAEVPLTKLHQVLDSLARMPRASHVTDPGASKTWVGILARDVLRTLNRRDGSGARRSLVDYGLLGLDQMTSYKEALAKVQSWIQLHVIALEIQRATYTSSAKGVSA